MSPHRYADATIGAQAGSYSQLLPVAHSGFSVLLTLPASPCLARLSPSGGGGTVIPYTKGPDSTNKRIIEFDTLANSVIDVEFNGRCTPNYGWL